MRNYLVYDAACAACSDIARRVEEASDGWLAVRPLDDPEIAAIVQRHTSGARPRPRLVRIADDGRERVLHGPAMTTAMVRGMGLRRAMAVLRIVRDELVAEVDTSRRNFLRTMGAGAIVASGFAFGSSAVAGGRRPESAELGGAGLLDLKARAGRNPEYQAALGLVSEHGYELGRNQEVAFDLGDDAEVLMTFIAHHDQPELKTALLMYRREGSVEEVVLEAIDATSAQLATSAVEYIEALQVVPLFPERVLPDSKSSYFGCMATCMGVRCGPKLWGCYNYRFPYLVLACMVVTCGSKVRSCHKICKHHW